MTKQGWFEKKNKNKNKVLLISMFHIPQWQTTLMPFNLAYSHWCHLIKSAPAPTLTSLPDYIVGRVERAWLDSDNSSERQGGVGQLGTRSSNRWTVNKQRRKGIWHDGNKETTAVSSFIPRWTLWRAAFKQNVTVWIQTHDVSMTWYTPELIELTQYPLLQGEI